MEKIQIFDNTDADKEFYENGFVKYGSIDNKTVADLIALSDFLDIPDYNGCDYNCGMNSDIYDLRKRMQDGIIRIISTQITDLLRDFSTYSATFVNKNPNDNCFVHAHQDFTYSREPKIPSVMCWIPLVNVDIHNGAMGFIPKSHTFYNHIRAFPFPFAKTAVTENEIKLMSYFKIVDMKAGELLFFMNNTVHGSFGNYSNSCRYAVTINFHKNGEKILAYVHNPKTEGKTLLKFEVDQDFIVENNNVLLHEMYNKGEISLSIPVKEEIPYKTEEISWENIENKLKTNHIEPDAEYTKIVDKYIIHQRNTKIKHTIKDSIYNFIQKLKSIKS